MQCSSIQTTVSLNFESNTKSPCQVRERQTYKIQLNQRAMADHRACVRFQARFIVKLDKLSKNDIMTDLEIYV